MKFHVLEHIFNIFVADYAIFFLAMAKKVRFEFGLREISMAAYLALERSKLQMISFDVKS